MKTLSAVVLIGMFCATAEASAREVDLAGRHITLPIPEGYCDFVPQDDREKRIIDVFQSLNGGHNQVLNLFVECGELNSFRLGQTANFRRYGMYLAQLTDNALKPITGTSRAAFIEGVVKETPKLNPAELAQEIRLKSSQLKFDVNIQRMGILANDEGAAYLGILGGVADGGSQPSMFAGVVAITIVKNLSLTANLYRPYVDEGSFTAGLAEAKSLARSLVASNPSDSDAGGFDWNKVIIGAAIGALVGAVSFGFKKLVRKKAP